MKKSYSNSPMLGLCAVALLIGTVTLSVFAAPAADEAHLTITRSPKLGGSTIISVLVDGKKVGSVMGGKRYEGSIPTGKHTLSVRFEPVSTADKPASIELNVAAGQTYSYSATIQHGAIALQKNR